MTNFKRKMKRSRLKALKKKVKKQLKNVEDSINNLPQECGTCQAPFESKDADKWMIRVGLEGAVMTCPACREEIYASENKEAES